MSAIYQFQATGIKDYSQFLSYVDSASKSGVKLEVVDDFTIRNVLKGHEEEIRESGLVLSVHGVFFDINPASNNDKVREISRRQMKESVEFAESIGAKNIIFHSSCITFLRGVYLDCWVESFSDFILELAESTSVRIFIENSQDIDSTPIRLLMEKCKGRIKCCLDLGHVNYSREALDEWVENLRPYIGYFHYSDNLGLFDKHLALGEGNINWSIAIKFCNEFFEHLDVPVTLEVGTIEKSVKALEFVRTGDFKQIVPEKVDSCDSLKLMDKINNLNDRLEIRNKLLWDTFGRYLSDSIVRQILDNPNGLSLGGKKKNVTILMSDLRGFTKICEQMEAQSLVEMINHYLGEMTAVIASFKGTILEFLGDGILAVFGAPLENEKHAADAIAASLEMQLRMNKINEWNSSKGYPEIQMGIGICTGDMIVGNIGSERHAKYGVMGSKVNLCGRIESYTTEGQIYISDKTLTDSGCDVGVEETIEISPKGMQEKIAIHRICSIGKPYNLSYHSKVIMPDKLESEIPVLFHTMEGKFVGEVSCQGAFTALSDKSAVLKTSFPLKRFENISIITPFERLAKVVNIKEASVYLVVFTSV